MTTKFLIILAVNLLSGVFNFTSSFSIYRQPFKTRSQRSAFLTDHGYGSRLQAGNRIAKATTAFDNVYGAYGPGKRSATRNDLQMPMEETTDIEFLKQMDEAYDNEYFVPLEDVTDNEYFVPNEYATRNEYLVLKDDATGNEYFVPWNDAAANDDFIPFGYATRNEHSVPQKYVFAKDYFVPGKEVTDNEYFAPLEDVSAKEYNVPGKDGTDNETFKSEKTFADNNFVVPIDDDGSDMLKSFEKRHVTDHGYGSRVKTAAVLANSNYLRQNVFGTSGPGKR